MIRTLSTILFLLFFLSSYSNNFKFKHIEVKDGLSNNKVNHIYKDSEGFMWFSTSSGLNRYDGNSIKIFRTYNPDKNILPDNYIYNVQEDAEKNIWIKTEKQYSIYNPQKELVDIDISAKMKKMGFLENPDLTFIDSEKNFWFSLYYNGIGFYDISKQENIIISHTKLHDGKVINIRECKDGILIIYNDGIIICVDKDTKEILWRLNEIYEETKHHFNDFFDVFVDNDQDIWIFGPLGLWIYNPAEKQWKNNLAIKKDKLSDKMIRAVSQDINGIIWIARDLCGGVDLFDKRTGKIENLRNDPDDERSLQNNEVNTLYSDKDRGMWVGTLKKGVSYYNESAFKFDIKHVGDINCIEEDKDNFIWLGTNDAGLIRWNFVSGEKHVYNKKNKEGLSADVIVCMLKSSDDKLWIGTFWGGLDCLDRNGRIKHYRNNPANANSLANNNVWALQEDKKGNIWIGTLGCGVQCFNPKTENFETYNVRNSDLLADHISSLFLTSNNLLLIGTSEGLSVLDIETGKILNYKGNRSGTTSLSNLNVDHIYEDSRGLWWIATKDLLNVYNPKTDDLRIITLEDGLSNPSIAGIIEDDDKNMWISTLSGITNIIISQSGEREKYNFNCYAYNDKDGLQNSEFNKRSIAKLKTGEILIGGLYGINSFKPGNIKYNKANPNVIFTNLTLFNEVVKIGEKYDNKIILEKSINYVKNIDLNYSQNIFGFEFTSDNYVLPDKMNYLYKLEGFNSEWLSTNQGKITYTSLPPGKYSLKIKAINNDGYTSEKEASLNITIHPPFWLTGWAYCIYLLFGLLFLIIGRNIILRIERNKYKLEQIELESLKNQEINDMKLKFFTNISHDLRTPLTLIISPLDILIKEHQNDDILSDKLKMIRRNSIRLLNLVNQLLDFRKGDVNGHQLNLSEGDIVEFVNNVCNSFTGMSDAKNVHLTFFSSIQSLPISFDEDKIGKIIMNLLSNAFKFTNDGGRVDISMDIVKKDDSDILEIKIADTGIGISDEEKVHIFERFYQAEQPNSSGSGIGLNIVSDFVELHGGSIKVFDNIPVGSVFMVSIPIKRLNEKNIVINDSYSIENILENRDNKICNISGKIESENYNFSQNINDIPPGEINIHKSQKENKAEDKRPIVLIVDDNDDFLTFMYDCLNSFYNVRIATNGAEAWEMIPELMPDLIISDYMMPKMSGKDLCRLVKSNKQSAHIPFIILSAKQSTETKLDVLGIGAEDYITKPFNVEFLLLRIKKLIDLKLSKGRSQITPEPSEITITSLDEKLIENAVKYVEENMSRSEFSVEELSRELGMSRVHLYKKLLAITNKTPIEFIRVIRLKRAAQMLRESQLNVSEIAYSVGFNNPKYFSKYFKEEFGVLPSTYQEIEGK